MTNRLRGAVRALSAAHQAEDTATVFPTTRHRLVAISNDSRSSIVGRERGATRKVEER